jgi:hypothetical protein
MADRWSPGLPTTGIVVARARTAWSPGLVIGRLPGWADSACGHHHDLCGTAPGVRSGDFGGPPPKIKRKEYKHQMRTLHGELADHAQDVPQASGDSSHPQAAPACSRNPQFALA